jgi:hypothetical protein
MFSCATLPLRTSGSMVMLLFVEGQTDQRARLWHFSSGSESWKRMNSVFWLQRFIDKIPLFHNLPGSVGGLGSSIGRAVDS